MSRRRDGASPVLILDGNQRSALAATRSLGSRQIPVIVADESSSTLAGSSKYCTGGFTYPAPSASASEFIAVVQREAAKRDVSVIFPMTDTTSYLLAQYRDSFPGVHIPLGSARAMETLLDKWKLWELARSLDIAVPRTWSLNTLADLPEIGPTLSFPLVVKPRHSRTWLNGTCIAAPVTYAHSLRELQAIIAGDPRLSQVPLLLQEYVSGEGQGVFALYADGRPLTFFAHRRLREKPPSGGVSVLSESIALDPRLREIAQRILDRVAWHGIVMLEFKVSWSGTPYLIEANPRFWGSLQLAIDAGVDFPYLLYQVALGEMPNAVAHYATGVKSRWLLGDLDQLYLTLRGHPGRDLRSASRLRALASFFRFFDPATRGDVNRTDDLKPFLLEIQRYLWASQ
jgi:predicted ATP-grasp superfamily ATP-dependent carboligase